MSLFFCMKTFLINIFAVIWISAIYATPFGLWNSPVTAENVAKGSLYIQNIKVEGTNTYLSVMRPENKGKSTIMRIDLEGDCKDMTPSDFDVRTFVHEYGGGAFTVFNGTIYASRGSDNQIYIIRDDEDPKQLTHSPHLRFSDMHISPWGLIAVTEKHEENAPVENFLSLINLNDGNVKKIASGYDFYSSPALSKDGKKIAWISWNHPEMPWTNTELWVAEFGEGGHLENQKKVRGSQESFFQPQWGSDHFLYFVTDKDQGYWNIHRYKEGQIENLIPMKAEVAVPLWNFDLSTYALTDKKIFFSFNQEGKWHLGAFDLQSHQWTEIPTSGSVIYQLRAGNHFVRFLEQYPEKEKALLQLDDQEGYPLSVIYSQITYLDNGYISIPQHISFPSKNRQAYGFYYPPQNFHYKNPSDEKPPLIVTIHGGPTSQTMGTFDLAKQFWTTRGYAILDVNYGGSTGYGRDFRNLLNHQWGIVDVEDAVNGALFLVKHGLADENRLTIRGGSSGGYTTLAALSFTNTFKAGASYYGISDIVALTKDTHKFEKTYVDLLIGKYPEEKKIWEERSPINSVDQIKAPLILFQGEEDKVVPKNQSMMIYDALKKKGIYTELYIYPEEDHGFRQSKNIIDALKKEEAFYQKVFNFTKKN